MAITVPYCEAHESGGHEYTETGGSATMKVICAYEDAFQLCQEAMGTTTAVGGTVFWQPPVVHPRRPYLYCREASFEPIGASGLIGSNSTWSKALVTLQFRTLDRDEEDIAQNPTAIYITEQQSASVEGLTLDDTKWKWSSGNVPWSDEQNRRAARQILIPTINLTYTINNWPNAPIAEGTLAENLGKINQYDFRALWQTWPAKTLLFANYNASRAWTSEGVTAWTVALNFIYRKETWQKFYRDSSGTWEAAVTIDGSVKPYEEVDFSEALFP